MENILYQKAASLVFALSLPLGAVFGPSNAHAVTLTLTPNVIATDFSGSLALSIGGLATGETVIVERFLDLNGDGVVGPGEPLAKGFRLTDGQATVIDGIVNINMPADLNPADGEISAGVRFTDLDRFAGKQIFRVSSPEESFTAVTAVLFIDDADRAQSISGVVRSGGLAVPYAFVGLISTGEDDELVAGAIADGAGSFTFPAPAADYILFAVASGYVISDPPAVTLTAAGTTQDVELTPATRVISGRLVDAEDSDIGLPGVELFFDSEDAFTFTFTDSEGFFTAGVTADNWKIEMGESALSFLGYLEADDEEVDTVAGDVTGLELKLNRVTALVYGYLTGPDEAPFAGIEIYADNNANGNGSGGFTDEDGYFVVGVTAGDWWVGPSQDDLADLGFSAPGTHITLLTGEASRVDFTAIGFTAYLTGRVVDSDGNGVADVWINANNMSGGWSSARTDENGYFSVGVYGGSWNLQLSSDDAAERGLIGPNLTFEVSDGTDIPDIAYIARPATAFISGIVQETDSSPVSSVGVSASTTVDGVTYNLYVSTDGDGSYSLAVFNEAWSVGVSGDNLYQRGLSPPQNQTVEITDANATANFTVSPIEPLEFVTTSLPEAMVGVFYWTNIEVSGGVPPYTVSFAPESNALPAGLSLGENGDLFGTPEAAGTTEFNLRVRDWFGNGMDQVFSLTVNAIFSGPFRFVQINRTSNGDVEMYLSGQTGRTYRIQASPSLSNPTWTPVQDSIADMDGSVYFRDTEASGFNMRFYRAVELP